MVTMATESLNVGEFNRTKTKVCSSVLTQAVTNLNLLKIVFVMNISNKNRFLQVSV